MILSAFGGGCGGFVAQETKSAENNTTGAEREN
jgi:hypothetical protein